MVKEKKPDPKKQLGEEDLMHDDHGPVIIGRRDQKPKIPEESKK